MSFAITIFYLLAGVINLIPVLGVVSGAQLERSYDVTLGSRDLVILMRHRAILFACVGGVLAGAAFLPTLRPTANVLGLLSMVSFIVIVLVEGGANDSIRRVMWVDCLGIVFLLSAISCDYVSQR